MRKQLKKIKNEAHARRYRRKLSIRSKIVGTEDRPRICAIRSNKNLTVQVVDDSKSKTIFSMHTFGKNAVKEASNTADGAKIFGAKLADELKKRGFSQVVF